VSVSGVTGDSTVYMVIYMAAKDEHCEGREFTHIVNDVCERKQLVHCARLMKLSRNSQMDNVIMLANPVGRTSFFMVSFTISLC